MTRRIIIVSFLVAVVALTVAADARQPYYAKGHVSQVKPYRSGYRVWIDTCRYPFFVPAVHYRSNPFGVGDIIRMGGYYNRRGFYDYYCFDCWRDRYEDKRDDVKFKYGTVRGKVQSIDERLGTFIIHAEGNDSDVTVRRGRDRGLGDLRVGDYLEVDGEWTRSGYFDAIRIDYAVAEVQPEQ